MAEAKNRKPKQFERTIVATCGQCSIDEVVYVPTIREAKEVLENAYGWKKTKEGWICPECAESK